jgi:hypothetical protein
MLRNNTGSFTYVTSERYSTVERLHACRIYSEVDESEHDAFVRRKAFFVGVL